MSMNFDDYVYVYRAGTISYYYTATNPRFVAEHKNCKAILKSDILKSFESEQEFLRDINNYVVSEKAQELIVGLK